MELNIKNPGSRILLEKVDNGVLLYEIGEDNVVTTKIVYEMYYEDGILDISSIGSFLIEMLDSLKIPSQETETNQQLKLFIVKIDPDKPMEGLDDEDMDDDEDE